jgi:hypothetical protein
LNGCGSYLQPQLIQNAFKMHYASANINALFSQFFAGATFPVPSERLGYLPQTCPHLPQHVEDGRRGYFLTDYFPLDLTAGI